MIWPFSTIRALRRQLAEAHRGGEVLSARIAELDGLIQRQQAEILRLTMPKPRKRAKR